MFTIQVNHPRKECGKPKSGKPKPVKSVSKVRAKRQPTRPLAVPTKTKSKKRPRAERKKVVASPENHLNHSLKVEEESPEYANTQRDLFGDGHDNSKQLGYSPTYNDAPFTNFRSIDTLTDLTALNLNWREVDLPEKERTKHVHRLHPYLGKYIPQLVEIFLRKFAPKVVYDPFAGSGTTLVEAKALGIDAIGSDVSAFNCLLMKVKTDTYDLRKLVYEIRDSLQRLNSDLKQSLFADRREAKRTDNMY